MRRSDGLSPSGAVALGKVSPRTRVLEGRLGRTDELAGDWDSNRQVAGSHASALAVRSDVLSPRLSHRCPACGGKSDSLAAIVPLAGCDPGDNVGLSLPLMPQSPTRISQHRRKARGEARLSKARGRFGNRVTISKAWLTPFVRRYRGCCSVSRGHFRRSVPDMVQFIPSIVTFRADGFSIVRPQSHLRSAKSYCGEARCGTLWVTRRWRRYLLRFRDRLRRGQPRLGESDADSPFAHATRRMTTSPCHFSYHIWPHSPSVTTRRPCIAGLPYQAQTALRRRSL